MPTTPQPLIVPYSDELRDPMGLEFSNLTTGINSNFVTPGSLTIELKYTEFLPDPLKSELQSLVPQINNAFTQIAASTVGSPVALQRMEELREPYLKSLLYMISGVNVGLAQLFP